MLIFEYLLILACLETFPRNVDMIQVVIKRIILPTGSNTDGFVSCGNFVNENSKGHDDRLIKNTVTTPLKLPILQIDVLVVFGRAIYLGLNFWYLDCYSHSIRQV